MSAPPAPPRFQPAAVRQIPAYPARVRSELDVPLSRWLWIVKGLLAVPYYVVLIPLWVAFSVLTVIAFAAILITGRYPMQILAFNADRSRGVSVRMDIGATAPLLTWIAAGLLILGLLLVAAAIGVLRVTRPAHETPMPTGGVR